MVIRGTLATAAVLLLAACDQPPSVTASLAEPAMRDASVPSDLQDDRVLLFGDTHVHSRNSVDAFASGVGSADIDSAYRYARGLPVIYPVTGQRVQIDRPLDFIVMADHAENLSISPRIEAGDPALLETLLGARFNRILEERGALAFTSAMMGFDQPEEQRAAYFSEWLTTEVRQTSWDSQIAAAERHNIPGTFTALIGWEWSATPNTRNLHRVVMTDAGGGVANQFLPFSSYDSSRPEDLWTFFAQTHARTGADFIGIPHNSNLSDGMMFALADSDGRPFDAAYAAQREAWEPVAEITQYKGTSEAYPALSPNDEFAGFELRNMLLTRQPTAPSDGSYLRNALLRGLAEEQRLGRNPFRYGFIGASDSHTGFAAVREDDFLGKMAEDFLPAKRLGDDRQTSAFPAVEMSASGLAGVWADHNDRQSIFAAFRRREVFGTSGPRMSVRLFAGYGFDRGDAMRHDFAAHGYRLGVPMGGMLLPSFGKSPQLLIRAVMDPDAARLDRVQVVKGWIDDAGEMQERIYNVAWSGNRRLRADGSLPAVGNTVDLATGRYSNTIGAPELATLWTDPDFEPAQTAFYYVRVLEIPTARHHLFDALALGLDPLAMNLPASIQERAWSSPVWYRPQ